MNICYKDENCFDKTLITYKLVDECVCLCAESIQTIHPILLNCSLLDYLRLNENELDTV